MTKNLTPFQQKLVDDLILEFTKINPEPTTEGKRFTVKSIAECNNEEQRFLDTIAKHNKTMMKVFINQYDTEIKAFKKEFGKVLDIQDGGNYLGRNPTNTRALWIDGNERHLTKENGYYEHYLFFVSKTKRDSSANYTDGMMCYQLYVDFKTEKFTHTLESGKVVYAHKIIGLLYSDRDHYRRRDKNFSGIITATLDEMIQTNKNLQAQIVSMAS